MVFRESNSGRIGRTQPLDDAPGSSAVLTQCKIAERTVPSGGGGNCAKPPGAFRGADSSAWRSVRRDGMARKSGRAPFSPGSSTWTR
jgi:hypothetical protein